MIEGEQVATLEKAVENARKVLDALWHVPAQMREEADATSVVFEGRVIQAALRPLFRGVCGC